MDRLYKRSRRAHTENRAQTPWSEIDAGRFIQGKRWGRGREGEGRSHTCTVSYPRPCAVNASGQLPRRVGSRATRLVGGSWPPKRLVYCVARLNERLCFATSAIVAPALSQIPEPAA